MSHDAAPDPHLAGALANAERRRAMLEELAQIGMNLARSVGAHAAAAMAAINEEKGGDPTRAFATVSRSVRLTLAMEARVDAQILALRNGKVPAGWSGARAAPRSQSPARGDVRDASGEGPGALRENLVDREDEEVFLGRPLEACMEAIRPDLVVEEGEAKPADPGLDRVRDGVSRHPLFAGPVSGPMTLMASSKAGSPASRSIISAAALETALHTRE